MNGSLNSSAESTCPWLARRWDREQRGLHPSDDNACYLWEECGVPPDVVQYCAGTLPWHGEGFVPVPVETQWSICLTGHYGGCRWLRERQWHGRETAMVCPLLGSRGDRHHKYLYPCTLNICHARNSNAEARSEADAGQSRGRKMLTLLNLRGTMRRMRRTEAPVPAERQKTVCLTKQFTKCMRYRESLPGS